MAKSSVSCFFLTHSVDFSDIGLSPRHKTHDKISQHTWETNATMLPAKNKLIILFNEFYDKNASEIIIQRDN